MRLEKELQGHHGATSHTWDTGIQRNRVVSNPLVKSRSGRTVKPTAKAKDQETQSLIVQLPKLLDHDWRAKSEENPPMVLATKINA